MMLVVLCLGCESACCRERRRKREGEEGLTMLHGCVLFRLDIPISCWIGPLLDRGQRGKDGSSHDPADGPIS